jgi:hypothetical protein
LTDVLLLVLDDPWLSDEPVAWALMVVVVSPSVEVWLILPLAGSGISRPLTVRLVLVLVPPVEEEFEESSETEDSDEAGEGSVAGAARLWTAGLGLIAVV